MNCAFDKEKLTGYYDGELGAAEKAEVERHIASCSECLRDLGELKSAALLVKELPRLRAPASIAAGVSREIQASGKLHVLAKFRRTVLWVSAAAAGLFIVMNAMYFGSQRQEASPTAKSPSVAVVANTRLAERAASEPAPTAAKGAPAPDRPAEEALGQDAGRRELADRKQRAPVTEQRKADASVDALKKAEPELNRVQEKKAAPEPRADAPVPAAPVTAAPGAPKPAAAPLAPAPAKGEEAKPVIADKEKEVQKVASEVAPKTDPTARGKAAALEAPAELPPIHCTLAATQLSKARPRMEEALKKMGIALPAPAPAPTAKAPRRDSDAVFTIEISDSQLAALREELEKPGDAKLMQSYPVEPVLPQFRSGGLFAKKEALSGAAVAGGKAKAESLDKDGKDAASAAQPAEPRRKVTLHLVEVKTLPVDVEERPGKK